MTVNGTVLKEYYVKLLLTKSKKYEDGIFITAENPEQACDWAISRIYEEAGDHLISVEVVEIKRIAHNEEIYE